MLGTGQRHRDAWMMAVCCLLIASACQSLVITEEDTAADRKEKIASRILLGVGTLGISEELIGEHERIYEVEKKKAEVLRAHFNTSLQIVGDIGKAEREILNMTRQSNPVKTQYHAVMAKELLNRASERTEALHVRQRRDDLGQNLKEIILDVVERKRLVIGSWLQEEKGAALAYEKLANEDIVKLLDSIIHVSTNHKYVFSQEEMYEILALRQQWQRLTEERPRRRQAPEVTF